MTQLTRDTDEDLHLIGDEKTHINCEVLMLLLNVQPPGLTPSEEFNPVSWFHDISKYRVGSWELLSSSFYIHHRE